MRKIVLILACVAMAVQAMGQAAPNRTWKTKVSDALGLMPAPDPAEDNRLMGDLLSTGSQGVDMLVSMFDGTNNVPVAYAPVSYTHLPVTVRPTVSSSICRIRLEAIWTVSSKWRSSSSAC